MRVPYRLVYSAHAREHLGALTARQRSALLDAIEVQLTHEPAVRTRNRKSLRPNAVADRELRVGVLRVYYDVDEQEAVVHIRAVGMKVRDRVYIGGREAEL